MQPSQQRSSPSVAALRGQQRSSPSVAALRGQQRSSPSVAALRGQQRSSPSVAALRAALAVAVLAVPVLAVVVGGTALQAVPPGVAVGHGGVPSGPPPAALTRLSTQSRCN
ncbi:MAG: hypothetical protein HYX57_06915 [Chloroflexi bacterium]|nr:hypothetical protein [Chloroflexota bacterium]